MKAWWAPIMVPAFLCTWSALSLAQSSGSERSDDASSIGTWAGLARHSPGRPFGTSAGNDLAIVAVRLTRVLHRSTSWNLDYSADLVPAAWVSVLPNPDTLAVRPCDPKQSACEFTRAFGEGRAVYGFGALPLGLQLRLAPRARMQPFLTAAGGGLWFREAVPHPLAGRFNFTAEVGAGILYQPTRSLGVIAGYKLQHISNGGTRPYNPGIDNNLFYLGLMRLGHTSSGGNERP